MAVKGLDEARDIVSKTLNANFNEIYFTSGGTEGDNWALRGFTKTRGNKNSLVISSIEHSAMLSTVKELEGDGIKVDRILPNNLGLLSADDFKDKLTKDTYLTACMFANNEVGTIQPIKEIVRFAHEVGSYAFTDAVQSVGAIETNVKDLGVDMMSISAHKFGGPKGVGAVYIKNGVQIAPYVTGGHQERQRRGGTSNVAGCIGLAYALKYTYETLKENANYVLTLRNRFIDGLLSSVKCAKLNGDKVMRLPNNANILFSQIDGERLLYKLDLLGICASLGAACSAGSIEPSHVLKEMGYSDKDAKSSIRFTFGVDNTIEQIDRAVEIIASTVKEM
jgi:cysteine desulfurase